MTIKRARTNEQIEARRDEIVAVAKNIYETEGLDKLNFFTISKQTKFTRPTIYNYFKVKEEIMLQLLIYYMGEFTNELSSYFAEDKEYNYDEIASAFTNAFLATPKVIELLTILNTTIERHVSVEVLTDFRAQIMSYHIPLSAIFKRVTKCDSEEKSIEFLSTSMALATGLYYMCFMSEKKKEAIKLSNTSYAVPKFEVVFKNAMTAQLKHIFN